MARYQVTAVLCFDAEDDEQARAYLDRATGINRWRPLVEFADDNAAVVWAEERSQPVLMTGRDDIDVPF